MDVPASAPLADPIARWEDARRVESWAGESRVNFIRALAVAAFYGHHLLWMYVLPGPRPTAAYHQTVTLIAAGWALTVAALQTALSRRFWPGWLKYGSVSADLFLTTLLVMAAGGPKSPLVVIYLMVVASAALRLSLRLVWVATGLCLFGYLSAAAFIIQTRPADRIAHPDQIVFMIAVGGVGLIAGQMVRQARRLIRGSPVEVEDAP